MSKLNTPGLGIEYEVHLPAYFALLLNKHKDVDNFILQSNVKDFGNLDDLLVDITLKNGEKRYFAFQLKHKENDYKNLLPTSFEAKGDFNLEKYCEAFKNLNDKKYHCILYTNKNFDVARRQEVDKFEMIHEDSCKVTDFFNTSANMEDIYKFEVNQKTQDGKNVTKDDYKLFFQQFSLYTGQINFDNLDKEKIPDILKHKEQYLRYIDVFRRWHRGEFTNKTIDKKTINVHLFDIFLEPFIIRNYQLSSGEDKKLELFESVVRKFDLTVIEVPKENFLQKLCENSKIEGNHLESDLLRLAKDSKMVDRTTKELTDDIKRKLICYFFEKPIIVDFNETSRNFIYETLELCQIPENRIKLVVLGLQVDIDRFSKCRIFSKLEDLLQIDDKLYEDVTGICKLSLQGKEPITLKHLKRFSEEIDKIVGPGDIFRMLKEDCLIGETKVVVPFCYVPRTVSIVQIPLQTVLEHCMKTSDLIIINFQDQFEKNNHQFMNELIDIVDMEEFLTLPRSTKRHFIILTEDLCQEKFKEVCLKNQVHVHYLKLINEGNFMLVMTTKNTFKPLDKLSIEENKIDSFLLNPINVFCAQPGMGKSTLLKSLKNQICSDVWTLMVDLKAHNTFLKHKRDPNEVLTHFMGPEKDGFAKKLEKHFAELRKITFFLDGLDEIESISVDNVLNFATTMARRGFRIWISSRQNLQQKIEEHLKISIIEIDGLDEKQQKHYIYERLQSKYKREEIEEIIEQIFKNVNVARSRQILGVPLQLYIITDIFLNDRKYYENITEDIFVLTKMYKIFFEGRYKHCIEKFETTKNTHLIVSELENQLEEYEIPALQTLFDDNTFKAFNLDLRRCRRFMKKIKVEKDPLGIIVNANDDNKAVFEHFTFAEYFACVFLVNNFEKVRILKSDLIGKRYQNLFLVFNLMLAEDNPLHLAVINRDRNQILKHIQDRNLFSIKKTGRNALHLAICSERINSFPNYTYHRLRNNWIRINNDDSFDLVEDVEHILSLLLLSHQSKDIFSKKDAIFKWNALEYALAFGSLSFVNQILEHINPFSFRRTVQNYYHVAVIAYYSLKYGFSNLLLLALDNKSLHLDKIIYTNFDQALHIFRKSSILLLLLSDTCANKIGIINTLLDSDVVDGVAYQRFGLIQYSNYRENVTLLYFSLKDNLTLEFIRSFHIDVRCTKFTKKSGDYFFLLLYKKKQGAREFSCINVLDGSYIGLDALREGVAVRVCLRNRRRKKLILYDYSGNIRSDPKIQYFQSECKAQYVNISFQEL